VNRALLAFLFGLITASVAAAVAGAASGTTPGANGDLVFRRYFDRSHRWGAIFTVTPAGGRLSQVTFPARGVLDNVPDWSPDGTEIAFVLGRGPRSDLWIAGSDGSNPRRLLSCSLPCNTISKPDWSPDGTRILVTRDSFPLDANGVPSTFEFLTVDPANATVTTLFGRRDGVTAEAARWSPDGTRVVFVRSRPNGDGTWGSAVFVADVLQGDERRITPWGLNATYPDWGPTDRIVFSSYDLGSFPGSTQAGNLYTIAPDGSDLHAVTTFGANSTVGAQPRWVPDGTAIIFTQVTRNGDPGGVRTMTLIAPDGTALRPATTTSTPGTHPTMQPSPA